jgi:AcrR family transcriptional regulator
MPAASIRARVRAEMTAEIKAVARRHLETDGANLSLRAVARDMGMVSSALYRYFASRDELLTALILDAYNALGDAVETAEAAVSDRTQLRARWLAATRAVRGWALANPAEYALLYGSPVPGYAAPEDTIAANARTPAVLGRILADGYASGALALVRGSRRPPTASRGDVAHPAAATGAAATGTAAAAAAASARLTDAVRADLLRARDGIAPGVPEELLLVALTGWIQMFGTISLELFGQFNNVIAARDDFFDEQMELMADLVGL